MQIIPGFEKRRIILREWLDGKGYHMAFRAMEYGLSQHTGVRKDGITPEFDHQLCIALYIRTLPQVLSWDETLAVAMLHDVREDKDVENEILIGRYGTRIADAVSRLTKVFKGVRRSDEEVFSSISECPIASLVKGADRIHNFQSMVGVFSVDKQKTYLEEGERFFLPMLRKAKANFPEQRLSYDNIKHMLKSQMFLIQEMHKASNR